MIFINDVAQKMIFWHIIDHFNFIFYYIYFIDINKQIIVLYFLLLGMYKTKVLFIN